MTCIVGIEHEGAVYVGGDSASIAVDSLEVSIRLDEKVFFIDNGEMLVGYAGSFRAGQLIRYATQLTEREAEQDDMSYMVVNFVDAIRKAQKKKGILKRENEVDEQDVALLVGFNGRLYLIDSDFQVARLTDGYAAIGTGSSLATGALYATRDAAITPEQRIMMALAASQYHSASVRAPFYVHKLEPKKPV